LKAETEEEAKERLDEQLNFILAKAPNYPDKTAVHFAAQIVADSYYGGEQNNEIFFIYPSDVLASQYYFAFNAGEKSFTRPPKNETKWNDVFVWPSSLDNPGVSVDAGIVFLPDKTPVDPETGSKYASEVRMVEGERKRVMVEDQKLISAFIEWAKNLAGELPAMRAYKEYREQKDYQKQEEFQRIYLDTVRSEMLQLGFDEEAAANLAEEIVLKDGMGSLVAYEVSEQRDTTPEKAAYKILKSANANWKKAENTITAKEYWERYFREHPGQKPKHIIFYDGDPTSAIREFQQKYGIGQADTSIRDGPLLGFDDSHVLDMRKDPRAWAGYDELIETAHRIIVEHYNPKR